MQPELATETPSSRPTISAILISYNSRQITLRSIAALQPELSAARDEIVVVDNASTDGSADAIAAEHPHLTLLRNDRNSGFGTANNQAIAIARGEFILLLNSDAFMHRGSLDVLADHLQRQPTLGVVGPKLLNDDGTLQPSVWPFPSPMQTWVEALGLSFLFARSWSLRDWRRWSHDRVASVPWVIGACLLVRRKVIEQVGGFDEAFFLYGEETDWERRIRDAGWEIGFIPGAVVTHLAGGSGKRQADRIFVESRRGGERFVRKHHGRTGLALSRAAIATGAVIRVPIFFLLSCLTNRNERHVRRLELWIRVWWWTIGRRGPGLND